LIEFNMWPVTNVIHTRPYCQMSLCHMSTWCQMVYWPRSGRIACSWVILAEVKPYWQQSNFVSWSQAILA